MIGYQFLCLFTVAGTGTLGNRAMFLRSLIYADNENNGLAVNSMLIDKKLVKSVLTYSISLPHCNGKLLLLSPSRKMNNLHVSGMQVSIVLMAILSTTTWASVSKMRTVTSAFILFRCPSLRIFPSTLRNSVFFNWRTSSGERISSNRMMPFLTKMGNCLTNCTCCVWLTRASPSLFIFSK